MRILFVFWFTLFPYFGVYAFENNNGFSGKYFGQMPPGMTPEIFAPHIMSQVKPEWAYATAFSPDGREFYFTKFNTKTNIDEILVIKHENGAWTEPSVTPFSGEFNDFDMSLSQDGNKIFFRSKRFLKNTKTLSQYNQLWLSERSKNEWQPAQPVLDKELNRIEGGYPTKVESGTLYFSYFNKYNVGKMDIYKSEFINGAYTKPKSLGPKINTQYSEGDTFVAPDESYMIVTQWGNPQSKVGSDLYISFNNNDQWSELINMGDVINTNNNEGCPYISPDGKYFFFLSVSDKKVPEAKTYWVDAKIIEQFRRQ